MKKYLIGLGCSWTQGEGGYPDHVVEKHNGKVQQYSRTGGEAQNDLMKYEHENSWVNVLCRDHFIDHTPINLGVKGIGNKAAVDQLYFCDRVDWENATGTIVLMWSGFERYDFLQKHPSSYEEFDDGYSDGNFHHYKWMAAWPYEITHGHEEMRMLWKTYAKVLWSEEFVAVNQMLNLLRLQTFAKAHGFNVVIANAFNYPHLIDDPNTVLRPHKYLERFSRSLYDKFDWSNYANSDTEYVSFVQKLVWEDNLLPKERWNEWFQVYNGRDWPSEYLTNCEGAHPTIKGYKVIADELSKFIKKKGYA